jgi:hypothetical protein
MGFGERVCRVCGCTDEDVWSFDERTGAPGYWVEPDLCSSCSDDEGLIDDLSDSSSADPLGEVG